MGSTSPVSYTDLLIIGAGPAGMMAAAWANQYQITTRIIDKNEARATKGQADGLQARTLEIFDSFGVVDHVWRKGFHDIEICTWVCSQYSPL
jgi:phenol 2-monooxygenase (NADPH)